LIEFQAWIQTFINFNYHYHYVWVRKLSIFSGASISEHSFSFFRFLWLCSFGYSWIWILGCLCDSLAAFWPYPYSCSSHYHFISDVNLWGTLRSRRASLAIICRRLGCAASSIGECTNCVDMLTGGTQRLHGEKSPPLLAG